MAGNINKHPLASSFRIRCLHCRRLGQNREGPCPYCRSDYAAYADLPKEEWTPFAVRVLKQQYMKKDR